MRGSNRFPLSLALCAWALTGCASAGPEAQASSDPAVVRGERAFEQTCVACHGPAGVGIAGLGAALSDNAFTAGLSDVELAVFIKTGRSSDDPANTTGVEMPALGGNPALTDADVADLVAYLRDLGK